MSTISKRWQFAKPLSSSHLKSYKTHPILAQLLYNRGVEPQDVASFLYTPSGLDYDPYILKDMRPAVDRIFDAIAKDEHIVVYGDFDADGVTSTSVMVQALTLLGANVKPYIPDRVDEGYGLNTPALENIAQSGVSLVITVDCGIRSVDEVHKAQSSGLDMIITDHHSLGPELPDALAVINPQQEDCKGDSSLAGVGVAFMLAWALLQEQRTRFGEKNYPDIRLSHLLDLVAIGTVADVMPLNSTLNRHMVKHGLKTLNNFNRPGVKALADVAGYKKNLTSMSIGFGLAPRINAAGRLSDAMIAVKMLLAEDSATASHYAEKLNRLNVERQNYTRDAQSRIMNRILESDDSPNLIIAVDEEVPQGIVGLVAGRLVESFYRPSIVIEKGEHESHASCRSIPEFHITQALDECADLLVRHGGHAMAAGFTILNENIAELSQELSQKADTILQQQELTPTIDIDMELQLSQLTSDLLTNINMLEPTGHANSQPIFATRNLDVLEHKTVGKDGNHLKLTLSSPDAPAINAIAFGQGHLAKDMPQQVHVAYNYEINEYQGRRTQQLNIRDIKPATETI